MTAKYHYKEYYHGELIPRSARVEIIKSDNKTYLIKTLDFCGVCEPGNVISSYIREKTYNFELTLKTNTMTQIEKIIRKHYLPKQGKRVNWEVCGNKIYDIIRQKEEEIRLKNISVS